MTVAWSPWRFALPHALPLRILKDCQYTRNYDIFACCTALSSIYVDLFRDISVFDEITPLLSAPKFVLFSKGPYIGNMRRPYPSTLLLLLLLTILLVKHVRAPLPKSGGSGDDGEDDDDQYSRSGNAPSSSCKNFRVGSLLIVCHTSIVAAVIVQNL